MWTWIKTNHQALTAVGAMVVGLAALFVAWDQARVMRAQQHAAVVPALQVDGFQSTTPNTYAIGLRVQNTGVGPAMIQSVTLTQNGEVRATPEAFLANLPDGYDISWTQLTGRAMAAGETATPMSLAWPHHAITTGQLYDAVSAWDGWDLQICYCSVFERCWITSPVGGARARRVSHCPVSDDDPFTDLGALQPESAPTPDTESEPVETPVESQG